MTPETVGIIKKNLIKRKERGVYLSQEEETLLEALAALEESQQQIKELQEGNRSACESRDMAYRSRDEAIVTSNQHYKQAFFLNEKLVEAQQTIARQQEAMDRASDMMNHKHPAYRLLQDALLPAAEGSDKS